MFNTPGDPRDQASLALSLGRWVDSPASGLLWLTDWPFYSALEMKLFVDLSYGGTDPPPLIEAPGVVFAAAHATTLELGAHLWLLMTFNWEGVFLAERRRTAIWIADEIIEVVSSDEPECGRLDVILDELNIANLADN